MFLTTPVQGTHIEWIIQNSAKYKLKNSSPMLRKLILKFIQKLFYNQKVQYNQNAYNMEWCQYEIEDSFCRIIECSRLFEQY